MGIRVARLLFCDNEHGLGEQTFPRIDELTEQDFVSSKTASSLRRDARKAGWSRDRRGVDYCNHCTAIDAERNND